MLKRKGLLLILLISVGFLGAETGTFKITDYKYKHKDGIHTNIVDPDFITLDLSINKGNRNKSDIVLDVVFKNVSDQSFFFPNKHELSMANDVKVIISKNGTFLNLYKVLEKDSFNAYNDRFTVLNPNDEIKFSVNVSQVYSVENHRKTKDSFWDKVKGIFEMVFSDNSKNAFKLSDGEYSIQIYYSSDIYEAKWGNEWHSIYSGPIHSNVVNFEIKK